MPLPTFPKIPALLALAALPLLALPLLVSPVQADDDWDDDDCHVAAGAQRIDSSRAIQIAEGLGYKVVEFEIDDGCVELKGSDRNGAKVKLRLDPVSGEVIPYRR